MLEIIQNRLELIIFTNIIVNIRKNNKNVGSNTMLEIIKWQ